jgi:uncharacterized membrane protein YqjE
MPERNGEARSVAELLKDVVGNVQEIIRYEVRLAKTEMREEAGKARAAAAFIAGGVLFAVYALIFVLLCVMFALAVILPLWLSALLVGVVLFMVAAILAGLGRDRWKLVHAKPEQTIETLKEDLEWRPQSR